MFASLLPGTVPCEVRNERVVAVHGVDVAQPIAAQMARNEARFLRAMGGEVRDG
jgi:hypothetical protein